MFTLSNKNIFAILPVSRLLQQFCYFYHFYYYCMTENDCKTIMKEFQSFRWHTFKIPATLLLVIAVHFLHNHVDFVFC